MWPRLPQATMLIASSGAHFSDAIVVGDQQNICGPIREQANRNNAGNPVNAHFHVDRIGNLEIVDVENVIAVISNKALAPYRLSTHLQHASGDHFLCHWQHFDRQRKLSKHANQLRVVDDANEASGRRCEDLFASQRTTATFDQLQVLIAFIRSVYIEIDIAGLI